MRFPRRNSYRFRVDFPWFRRAPLRDLALLYAPLGRGADAHYHIVSPKWAPYDLGHAQVLALLRDACGCRRCARRRVCARVVSLPRITTNCIEWITDMNVSRRGGNGPPAAGLGRNKWMMCLSVILSMRLRETT